MGVRKLRYAAEGHTHGGGAVSPHTHPESDVTGLVADLAAAGLPGRNTVSFSTTSLASGATQASTFALYKGYRLLQIATNRPARVELYTTTGKRDADAGRAVGTDPTGDHGVVLDYVTTATVLSADLSPVVAGFDGAASPTGTVPYRVTNLDSVTGAVTVTFTYQKAE